MRISNSLLTLFVLTLLVWGCYPKGPEYIDDLDSTLTTRDPAVNFAEKTTYFIADSVNYITNDPKFQRPDYSVDLDLIRKVRENMNARGYTEIDTSIVIDTVDVTNPDNPDFFISIIVVNTLNTGTVWYPIGGWGGWWWGGWGWSGGWWYPTTYSFSTGSCIVDLGDFKNTDVEARRIPLAWEGVTNGVLSSYRSTNVDRALNGIDQMFIQSEYIQAK